ncbi:hypothetical protein KCP70_02910 [Salmonella enterica subsp. enterica]|nr:hypothetical protein KCP70_02910 [Salmonella enterica subsp. enterica]
MTLKWNTRSLIGHAGLPIFCNGQRYRGQRQHYRKSQLVSVGQHHRHQRTGNAAAARMVR